MIHTLWSCLKVNTQHFRLPVLNFATGTFHIEWAWNSGYATVRLRLARLLVRRGILFPNRSFPQKSLNNYPQQGRVPNTAGTCVLPHLCQAEGPVGHAMTDLGNGVGATASLGSSIHPSREPSSWGPVCCSVSEWGKAACSREAGGLLRMRRLYFLRGWRGTGRRRKWTKRVSPHPGPRVTCTEPVSLALPRGPLPGEGRGYVSSRAWSETTGCLPSVFTAGDAADSASGLPLRLPSRHHASCFIAQQVWFGPSCSRLSVFSTQPSALSPPPGLRGISSRGLHQPSPCCWSLCLRGGEEAAQGIHPLPEGPPGLCWPRLRVCTATVPAPSLLPSRGLCGPSRPGAGNCCPLVSAPER